MQEDGNFVVYKAVWASNTAGRGHNLQMQTDGNLVLYDNDTPTFSSLTHGTGKYLKL